jgi:hypothetical protein
MHIQDQGDYEKLNLVGIVVLTLTNRSRYSHPCDLQMSRHMLVGTKCKKTYGSFAGDCDSLGCSTGSRCMEHKEHGKI